MLFMEVVFYSSHAFTMSKKLLSSPIVAMLPVDSSTELGGDEHVSSSYIDVHSNQNVTYDLNRPTTNQKLFQ